jgi:hypothetical protein
MRSSRAADCDRAIRGAANMVAEPVPAASSPRRFIDLRLVMLSSIASTCLINSSVSNGSSHDAIARCGVAAPERIRHQP